MSEAKALAVSARSALVLLAFTFVFTALMALTYGATRDIIRASVEAEKMKLVNEVLPPGTYDNPLLSDHVQIAPSAPLGLDEPTQVFRARRGAVPVALVLEAQAADGYGGAIRLLVAAGADGRIVGVRVTQHRETPGLGDYIDPRKDRNKAQPWIKQFDTRGFAQLARERWRVRKDGGSFDYVTGATISARAVTGAVARALAFADRHREELFAAAIGAKLAPGG